MDFLKNIFGFGDGDKKRAEGSTTKTAPKPGVHSSSNRPEPLLRQVPEGNTRHTNQGFAWSDRLLRHDEDGDAAHGFIVCDEMTTRKSTQLLKK